MTYLTNYVNQIGLQNRIKTFEEAGNKIAQVIRTSEFLESAQGIIKNEATYLLIYYQKEIQS